MQNPISKDGVLFKPQIVSDPKSESAAVPQPRLCLLDLAALDATGTHADALGGAVHHRLHRLKVHIPAALGHVVRVRNIVAKLRPFAANITYLCHLNRSKLVCISAPAGFPRLSSVPGMSQIRNGRWGE